MPAGRDERAGKVASPLQWVLGARYTSKALEDPGGMAKLVADDAAAGGESLTAAQAKAIADGIRWRNTLENYTHMGLVPRSGGIVHLEDSISNISGVLARTGAMSNDPSAARPADLFYSGVLASMKAADFHPSKGLGIASGGPGTGELEAVRAGGVLTALPDAEWDRLTPVGSLQIKPIAFHRGKAILNVQSERELDELARRLASLPRFYLTVRGHARAEGDADANMKLARERAGAALEHLVSRGVSRDRVRAVSAPLTGTAGGNQSVSFMLAQRPY